MVHFFVHFVQQFELRILETSEPRPKQTRRPESQKHTKDPPFGYLGVFQ